MLGVVRTRRQSHENAIPSYVRVRLSGHSGLNRMRYGTSVEWNGDGGSRLMRSRRGGRHVYGRRAKHGKRKHSASTARHGCEVQLLWHEGYMIYSLASRAR